MHHHTTFGSKRLSGLENIFQRKPPHTDGQGDPVHPTNFVTGLYLEEVGGHHYLCVCVDLYVHCNREWCKHHLPIVNQLIKVLNSSLIHACNTKEHE